MSLIKGPDFVIAGAARCGTTSLYCVLDKHPEIYMAKPMRPEPKFFSRESIYARGVDWYLVTYFKDRGDKIVAGEKSTEYMEASPFPSRAVKHFPKMKVIIMLRDPVERTISNYWWSVKGGYEKRTLEEAIKDELPEVKAGTIVKGCSIIDKTRPNVYIGRSFYSEKLRNIFECIPHKQVLLIDFAEYTNSFMHTIMKIFGFLGVNPIAVAESNAELVKNEAERKAILDNRICAQLQEAFASDIAEVNQTYGLSITCGYL